MSRDCELYREDLAALRRGEAPERPEVELRAHLAACAGCRRAGDEAGRLFELLDEFQPAPGEEGLDRLRLAISAGRYLPGPAEAAPRRRLRPVLVAAAAAAAVVAAAWVGSRLAGSGKAGPVPPARVAVLIAADGAAVEGHGGAGPGTVLFPGARVRLSATGHARLVMARGAQVDLAGGSVFEVAAGDRLYLKSGRLLAVVRKGDAPFRVVTGQAEVATLGTRFTVEAGDGSTAVAVSEGRVRCTHTGPGDGSVEVGGGEASTVLAGSAPRPPRAATAEELAWMPGPPRPRLELELELDRPALRPGERLSARLRLVNRSAAEAGVDGTGRGRPSYFVRVEDPAGRRSHFAPAVLAARVGGMRTEAPLVAVPGGGAYELELDLGPLSGAPGEYRLTAIYLESAASASTGWSGALESAARRVVLETPPAKSTGGRGPGALPGR
jgi:ferric-dicitrate binding protein FerR (iron transport regulator)